MNLYGLFISLATLFGFLYAKKRASLFKIPTKEMDNLFLIVLPLSLIGARLYHVFDKWSFYSGHPESFLYVWKGGLGILGALFGGLLGVILYWFFTKRFSLTSLLDLLAPSLLLGQAIGRFGNYFNQEGFGPPTSLPWGIYIDPARRPYSWQNFEKFHPTFFYEALWDFFGFLIIVSLEKKLIKKPFSLTAFYLIIYGLGRFLIEFFRFDTASIMGIKVAQMISFLMIFIGLIALTRRRFWNNLLK